MEDKNKIFVKLNDYNDIKEILDLMHGKIDEAKDVLEQIKLIRAKEEDSISKWSSDLNEIEDRIKNINKSLTDV